MLKKIFPVLMVIMLGFSLAGGCARGRIEGDRFVSPGGGYRVRLPGEGWAAVRDGWKHRWELGYRNVLVKETYKYITRRRETMIRRRRVITQDTTREVDQPARMEQRDVFKVDTAFVYKGLDIKIIVATARLGDLYRYVRERGAAPDPRDRRAIIRAYFQTYPSFISYKGDYRFVPDMRLNGSTVDYLELGDRKEVRAVLAGRLMGNRLMVAYYRAGADIPAHLLDATRRDFRKLAASITDYR